MPKVGYLGTGDGNGIIFQASDEMIVAMENMNWSGAARYATHQRHNTDALTEFVGLDPDKFSFSITLMADAGVEPMSELVKIWKFEREHTTLQLVMGDHAYGKYRWTITDHKEKTKYFDAHGNLYCVDVSINLLEYLAK